MVQPGTVYQALNDGEPAGTFVVNMPKLSNWGWIGDGRWTPHRALDDQLAAEAAKHPKPTAKQSKAIFTGDADNGPPVLCCPGSDQSSTQAKAPQQTQTQTQTPAPAPASPQAPAASQPDSTTSTTTSDSLPAVLTLRRPGDEPDSSPPPTLQPVSNQPQSVDDTDPDRPVLRKPSSPPAADSAAKQQASTPQSDHNDPDRPVLTRGSQPVATQARSAFR